MAEAAVKPEKDDKGEADSRTVVQKLFSDIAPRFAARPGGYTRILKRHEVRLGDAGATAFPRIVESGRDAFPRPNPLTRLLPLRRRSKSNSRPNRRRRLRRKRKPQRHPRPMHACDSVVSENRSSKQSRSERVGFFRGWADLTSSQERI